MERNLREIYLKAKRDPDFLAWLDKENLVRPGGAAPNHEKESFALYYANWIIKNRE